MSISTTSRKSGPYPGNGVARTFSFNFKVFDETELRVSVISDAGLEQVLPLNVGYTVALNPDQDADAGGTVTLSGPLAVGNRLVILSDIVALQPIDMTNQGGFYPETVNEGFDRVTALVQQVDERLGRAITVPPSFTGGNLQLPEPKPGQIVAWGDNDQLSNLDPSGLVTVVAYGNSVSDVFDGDGSTTVFELSASPGTERNMRVSVAGVVQIPGVDFEWGGGQVLTFYEPPPAGTKILAQFQEALPEFGSAQSDLSNVDPDVGRAALEAAKDDLSNVDPGAGRAALEAAKDDLSNVAGDDFADKSHTVYSYGQATRTRSVVPKSISDRFAEYASTEDFGIRLYQSGNSGPLQDNTAALQEAVDKIQARDGCLWVANFGARYGSTTVMTGPVAMRTGVHGGVDYTGKGFAMIGVEPGDRSAWAGGRYNAGQGFKLTSGSTSPLFTSPAGAGILVMENLLFAGNGNDARGIELSNASGSGAYGMGAHMKHVYINGFGRAGFHVGSGRGRGTTEWVWVEYCGGTSTEAAWAQLAYDWEHYSVGIGVNANAGLYVGNGSQVRFIGGASWMNDIGVQVDSSAMDVDFIGFHFDNANRTNLVVIGHENFGGRIGGRRFVSCRFSGASQAGNGAHPAIKLIGVKDGDTIFTAPDFAGGHGAEAALPSYLVEADANSIFRVDDFVYEASGSNKPYVTAPINNWNRLRMGGNTRTHIGISNNGDGMTATAGGVVSLEVRDKQVALGGAVGAAPFQAETVSGGVNNKLLAQSTSAGFNFAILRATSANGAPVDLALQGSNGGLLRFGVHSAVASETVTGYITIRDDSGVARKIAVIS